MDTQLAPLAVLYRDVNDILGRFVENTVQFLPNFAVVAVDFFE